MDANTIAGFFNVLFGILNGVLVLYIKRNTGSEERDRAAARVADRLIELQGAEQAILIARVDKLLTELNDSHKREGKLEAEKESLVEKLTVLTDAIHTGTAEYRQAVTQAITYKEGQNNDEQRFI